MINLSDVDPIIIAMRPEPFDPHNSFLEINGDYQTIRVASYVENDPITRDDAGGSVKPLHVGSARPFRLPHLVKPSIERRLERSLIPVPGPGLDELSKRPPSDNPHSNKIGAPILGASRSTGIGSRALSKLDKPTERVQPARCCRGRERNDGLCPG
jgi:hypothetical protein